MQLRVLAKTVGVDSVVQCGCGSVWKRDAERPDAVEVAEEVLHIRKINCQKLVADIDCVRIVMKSIDYVLDSECFVGDIWKV